MQPNPQGLGAADLGRPQSFNRYSYDHNDPVNFGLLNTYNCTLESVQTYTLYYFNSANNTLYITDVTVWIYRCDDDNTITKGGDDSGGVPEDSDNNQAVKDAAEADLNRFLAQHPTCEQTINDLAKAKGKETIRGTLSKTSFRAADSSSPDWNKTLGSLGDQTSLKQYTLADLFTGKILDPDGIARLKDVIGYSIPEGAKPIIYLGTKHFEQSAAGQDLDVVHELLHGIFQGDHLVVAKSLNLGISDVLLSRLTSAQLSTLIDNWLTNGCKPQT